MYLLRNKRTGERVLLDKSLGERYLKKFPLVFEVIEAPKEEKPKTKKKKDNDE